MSLPKNSASSAVRYEQEIADIEGLKTGTQAMRACGMQPEFAAHLMQQCQAMKNSVILRAGSPPVYNQKRGPKTGFTLSKTSTQGFFKGSLAKDIRFTRLVPEIDPKTKKVIGRKPAGHDPKDAHHLHLSPKDPDYLHTVPLPVTMQDILRELRDGGDLKVLGYENGILRLCYLEGKGAADFQGQFIIDLKNINRLPLMYSRPWDRPDHDPAWNPNKKMIEKPDALKMVPDDVYRDAFEGLMTLNFSESTSADLSTLPIKPALVFANTPRTSFELKNAILSSGVLSESDPVYRFLQEIGENLPARETILQLLSEEQLIAVYNKCGLVTTGDWDGLALGEPIGLTKNFPHPGKLRVYNTFSRENAKAEIKGLLEASCDYVDYLKNLPEIKETNLGKLLSHLDDPSILFSEFALARAGCITPHEFVYQQLINYTYRDQINDAYGNTTSRKAMQAAMDAALHQNQSSGLVNEKERFQRCLDTAIKVYEEKISHTHSQIWKNADKEHLVNHLKIALKENRAEYLVPNISHDHNVHDLFQHGFDMRNPYGSNLEGAWLMVTNNGLVIYGETEEKLIEALLVEGFLENNLITVSHGANMKAGWDLIIQRQLMLGQPVPEKTMAKWKLEGRMNVDIPLSEKEIETYRSFKAPEQVKSMKLIEKFREMKAKVSALGAEESLSYNPKEKGEPEAEHGHSKKPTH